MKLRSCGSLLLLVGGLPWLAADEGVTYNRDVRPILSDRCFACHGPDAKKRAADLRLDEREGATESGAIVEGKPDESEMLRRILSEDADERMPPPDSKLEPLTKQEIEVLRKWIADGAKYEGHWSFLPLKPVAPELAMGTNVIDLPVERQLAKLNLKPQPEADRATLIRRLSFDLTGLPPTHEEVLSFEADTAPNAYENLVDRLLASEQYGERMAVDWLDAARYADSYGFQVDRERDVWPWRDWVIRSFNANQPFDEFITWQLAGDLLPNATDEQLLATAFNRLHQQESEGGSVEEEYRVEYVADRVQTFATTFLGLTFECARCHDHKYDPITQKEYYQLFSMFQNIDEAGLYSYFTMSPPTPTAELADAPTKEKLAQLQIALKSLEESSPSLQTASKERFQAWSETLTELPPSPAGEAARFQFETLTEGKLANDIKADQPAVLKGENKLVEGKIGQAVEFTGDDAVDLPLGNFKRQEPFTIAFWMKTPDVKERAVVFHRSRAWTDAASRGYELLIEEGRLKWSLIHFWPGNAVSIAAKEQLPMNEWVHVAVSSDGSSRASGLRLFINGQLAETEVIKDKLTREITGGGGDNIALAERFRDRGFKGGAIDDFRVFTRVLSGLEVLQAFDPEAAKGFVTEWREKRNQPEGEKLDERMFEYYLGAVDPEWTKYLSSLVEKRGELYTLEGGIKEIMAMRELPEAKPAYVLFRGEYDQRRDEVRAGTPAALSAFPEGEPRNRLGLARWLTAPDHPLTARVTVNRVWQSLFGRGLVKTSEDFGSQGSRPLYPEILDGLSRQFIENGWNLKRLIKSIVMSRTYRQQSIADAKTMADDPDNEWLARGPRYRLSAEMIRDNALAAAGLLNKTMYGAPVSPYEMSEAFKPATPSDGGGVYRRSLYTQWRRTAPPPAMLAFDAPRRAVCLAKRERTDSPLQALILLNGIQYVEAARVLGETLHQEQQGDLPKMIEEGFLRTLSRRPDPKEIEIATRLYREQLDYYTQHPAEAEELLKIGQRAREGSIPAPTAAALTVFCQALLNHDACVVKR